MKNTIILVAIVACIAVLVESKPDGEGNRVRMTDYGAILCSVNQTGSHLAVLSEMDVNFSPATIKVSHHDNAKTYEKQLKYKLPVEENLKIERSVENYIFYMELVAGRYNDLSKLRRLNI